MMVITIGNRDDYGREGVLNINGLEIETPTYLPNQREINNINECPFKNGENFPNIGLGTYIHWLDLQKIITISEDEGKYKQTKDYLKSKLKQMGNAGIKRKLLHFEFYNDISLLPINKIDFLLKLQHDVGADVIEIPNIYSTEEYERVLDRAINWQKSESVDKELMGIANTGYDIENLKNKTNIINCLGINLKKESPALLFPIRQYLKQENVWVHAFSVPRSFKIVGGNGTLTVLLNYYGIDTISTFVQHPKGLGSYFVKLDGMDEDQKIEKSMDLKYFNPNDYSTTRCRDMANDVQLSKFCKCPVCQSNTIGTLMQNTNTLNSNLRSHEVFAYMYESSNYQNEIKHKTSDKYFNSKKYAKEIAHRFSH
jgi:queuine/archaeosine tRNA-ribosyltransferase